MSICSSLYKFRTAESQVSLLTYRLRIRFLTHIYGDKIHDFPPHQNTAPKPFISYMIIFTSSLYEFGDFAAELISWKGLHSTTAAILCLSNNLHFNIVQFLCMNTDK